jgi:hypothetical protein
MHRVDRVFNSINDLCGKLEEHEVVNKVLITLPKYYSYKVFAIEEA